ncbi:uncharacterized protein LOC128222543 isoform X3 [Mya arenaria]|uniref:uncharacterized protein LOC128222543 isoform X3 n=1 Tax=Mya arenaria TaxID=6604 RepID=UPI0022E22C12|nr:uncharacterized protein LOC128222543 isoform X3 [Mya arenaria]
MLTTRRGKIHELLSNYKDMYDERFQTLATNIKHVRKSRSKEAYPVNIFDGEFVYTICDGKFTRINHMRGAWLFQQEISAGDTVDHILYDTLDSKYAFEVCETLAESGRRYATSNIESLHFDLVDRRNDCVVLIASTGESPLKHSSLHHDFRRMILKTEHMLNVMVIHENNLGDKRVDLWMNDHIPLPFEVRHVGSNDKLCLKELFGSIHKRRFPHDQHLDVNIFLTGDTFAHENTVYRELTKEDVGCTLINVDSLRSIDQLNRGKDYIVLNVLITGKDAEEDFFKSIQDIDRFIGRTRFMIKPIDIDLCNDQWLQALKLELKGDFSYDVEISIDCADRFGSRNLLLQYRLLASSGLRCILVLEHDWYDLPTPKVIHSKATLQIKYNTGLLCLRNQFDVTRDDQMWPFKVKAMIKKNESPKRNEERTRTIIIRHLEGRFEYENKIYTEVVNLGLGCRIVSEFSDEDFVYPDTVPCVLIHKGVDLNNESLFGHTEKVWQVLILDMDDNSAENVHTLMKGLRYRIHGIDLENVRWPQELLKRLTGVQKTVDGTAYEVCISFDNCNAKHAEIVYKGLENIGHRCLYRSTAAHEKGFRHDDCLWLQKVPSEYIDVDSVYDVPNQQLKVLVNDKTSKGVIEPLEANTISISLEDTEWPEKVKAKLKAFKSTDRPLYQDSASTRWSGPFCDYSSSEDEDVGCWTAFQSIEKPTCHESALTVKLALSRSGYRSMIDETKSSLADVAD